MYRYIAPKKRSRLRIEAGRFLYSLLRYGVWMRNARLYRHRKLEDGAKAEERYCHAVFSHATPLFRNLSDIDCKLQKNKVVNLRLAVRRLDGFVLEPGKVFSYWKEIGAPIALRGFRKGVVLVNGVPTERIGGGLCQLSNLLYWMTVHTSLTVIERYRHSFDVFPDQNRTQPFGSGATCVYNYRDLQIRNDTNTTFVLRVSVSGDKLEGSWKTDVPVGESYEVYERSHWITQEMGSVYVRHNILGRRHFFEDPEGRRELASDDILAENHAIMMYSPLISAPTSFAGSGEP